MKRTIVGSSLAAAIAFGAIGYSFAQQTVQNPLVELPTDDQLPGLSRGLPSLASSPASASSEDVVYFSRPARMENDNLTAKLLAEYQKTNDASTKNRIVTMLSETVGKQFDSRQAARDKELRQLEDQLTKLKAVHSKRTSQKDRIVKDRVQQLINNIEGIGWGTDVPVEGFSLFNNAGPARFNPLQLGTDLDATTGAEPLFAPSSDAQGLP